MSTKNTVKRKSKKNLTQEELIQSQIDKRGYDPYLIHKIQPKGGISFRHERYIKKGNDYTACLYIGGYPTTVLRQWLVNLTNIDNVITTIDVSSEDPKLIKYHINKSLEEQELKFDSSRDRTDKKDAQEEYSVLNQFYEELGGSGSGKILKLIHARIFISGKTLVEVDERVKEIIDYLEGIEFTPYVELNGSRTEWDSLLTDFKMQKKSNIVRTGQPIAPLELSAGLPFHHTSLNDKYGYYLGYTSTGGQVIIDLFQSSKERLSFNGIIFGGMGSGKSTTMKKAYVQSLATRGDFVRGFDFDPKSEYSSLVNYLGGKVISLDGEGSHGILNALEILATSDVESASFLRHIDKVANVYKFLDSGIDKLTLASFRLLVRKFYEELGFTQIIDELKELSQKVNDKITALEDEISVINQSISKRSQAKGMSEQIRSKNDEIAKLKEELLQIEQSHRITSLPPQKYPIWSDFLKFVNREIEKALNSDEIDVKEIEILRRIFKIIEDFVVNYGTLVDGYTSIENITDKKIVFFNVSQLSGLDESVANIQLYLALLMCWDNCIKVGGNMKQLVEDGKLKAHEADKFVILVDEAHRIFNEENAGVVNQITAFARESRKYFAGIVLSSQSIRDYVPEGSSNLSTNAIKTFFSLAQYHWVLRQNRNDVELLKKVYGGTLTDSEIELIPSLERGECILSIAGDKNIHFNVDVSDYELGLYKGGV